MDLQDIKADMEHARKSKRKGKFDFKVRKLYSSIRRKLHINVNNELIKYKAVLKLVWAYGVHLSWY